MTERIKWDPKLSVGIGDIDTQHREFISIMQQLARNIQADEDKKIEETIAFLEKYSAVHFNLEQMYMTVYSYPDASVHLRAHEEFKKEIAGLRRKLKDNTITAEDINRKLWDYFFKHIKTIDMQLASFLIKKIKK